MADERAGGAQQGSAAERQGEMGIALYVLLIVSVLLLMGDVIGWFGLSAVPDTGGCVIGILVGVQGGKTRNRNVIAALAIVSVLGLAANVGRGQYHRSRQPAQRAVAAGLDWQGPLDINQTGTFTFPYTTQFSTAKIDFRVEDANPAAPVCAANTALRIDAGTDANNMHDAGLVSPGNRSASVTLPGYDGTFAVRITITRTLFDGQQSCPVVVTVPLVTLERAG